MPVAGYRSQIRRGGFPTSTVSEPFTSVSGTRYQITDATKRVIDATQPWHLSHTAGTISFASIGAFDFMFGEADVNGVSGTLRFTGKFIPLTTASEVIAEVTSHEMTETTDLIDTTVYTGPSGSRMRKRIAGLADCSISLGLNLNLTDMDTLATLNHNASRVVLEISSAFSPVFRGMGFIENITRSGAVDGKVEATVDWKVDAYRDPTSNLIAGYSERNIVST